MRKFDLRYEGATVAWSLDLRDVVDQLFKLADDRYELWDKATGELAYTIMPGWRAFDLAAIVDEKTLRTMTFASWADHEYYEYGM